MKFWSLYFEHFVGILGDGLERLKDEDSDYEDAYKYHQQLKTILKVGIWLVPVGILLAAITTGLMVAGEFSLKTRLWLLFFGLILWVLGIAAGKFADESITSVKENERGIVTVQGRPCGVVKSGPVVIFPNVENLIRKPTQDLEAQLGDLRVMTTAKGLETIIDKTFPNWDAGEIKQLIKTELTAGVEVTLEGVSVKFYLPKDPKKAVRNHKVQSNTEEHENLVEEQAKTLITSLAARQPLGELLENTSADRLFG